MARAPRQTIVQGNQWENPHTDSPEHGRPLSGPLRGAKGHDKICHPGADEAEFLRSVLPALRSERDRISHEIAAKEARLAELEGGE